jgi:hypothetical protein
MGRPRLPWAVSQVVVAAVARGATVAVAGAIPGKWRPSGVAVTLRDANSRVFPGHTTPRTTPTTSPDSSTAAHEDASGYSRRPIQQLVAATA